MKLDEPGISFTRKKKPGYIVGVGGTTYPGG